MGEPPDTGLARVVPGSRERPVLVVIFDSCELKRNGGEDAGAGGDRVAAEGADVERAAGFNAGGPFLVQAPRCRRTLDHGDDSDSAGARSAAGADPTRDARPRSKSR